MGMFDHVVVLDEPFSCPVGHVLTDLQTKSFPDPSMSTYLIHRDLVLRTAGRAWSDGDAEDERSSWRIAGEEAVHETRYRLEPVSPPAEVNVYTHCDHCEPVLVRTDRASLWGDVVQEHRPFVELVLRFSEGEPISVHRVSGDRAALEEDLRRSGVRVLADDEPLAIAHREIQRARQAEKRTSRQP